MRAIWIGSISFGLINTPVRLYSAFEEHPIAFDLLHRFHNGEYLEKAQKEGRHF